MHGAACSALHLIIIRPESVRFISYYRFQAVGWPLSCAQLIPPYQLIMLKALVGGCGHMDRWSQCDFVAASSDIAGSVRRLAYTVYLCITGYRYGIKGLLPQNLAARHVKVSPPPPYQWVRQVSIQPMNFNLALVGSKGELWLY